LENVDLEDKIYYLKCSLLESSFFKRANIQCASALFAFADFDPHMAEKEMQE